MWKLLAGTVGRKPSRKRRTIAIDDSKRLYGSRRANGLEHLERGVLASLAASGVRPGTLGGLLAEVSPVATEHTSRYAWYADVNLPLPRAISATDAAFAGNALAVALRRVGIRPLGLRAECVLAGELNRMLRLTRNKSLTLFGVTSRLLMHAWQAADGGRAVIHVDRQGGRRRYLPHLQRMFEGCRLKVLDEGQAVSAYRVSDDRRTAEILFATGGDRLCLPTALASMTSKYLRELFMARLNSFWVSHTPGLKPTAGYYTDGNRFFGEIAGAMKRLGVERDLVYRER